jgi:hypothetical protein
VYLYFVLPACVFAILGAHRFKGLEDRRERRRAQGGAAQRLASRRQFRGIAEPGYIAKAERERAAQPPQSASPS